MIYKNQNLTSQPLSSEIKAFFLKSTKSRFPFLMQISIGYLQVWTIEGKIFTVWA